MYLSSITQADFPPKQKHIVRAECLSLKTGDIEGAQPQLRGYRYINKPEFYNRTWDIERAQPALLPVSQKTRDLSLTTEDIPRAQPMKNEFKTKRLGHNPLEPVYKLPTFETRPITPPRFVRDSHTTKDIDGARPEVYFKWKTRDILTTDDIEGSRPKPETIYKKPNFMDPRDINQVAEFSSKRSVNPLAPEYIVRDEAGNLTTVGFVDGSKPRELVRTTSAAHNRHITTEDIEGAKASTKGLGPFAYKPREHFRNSIDVADIEGAQMSSLKKAPVTKRCTNPVTPDYQYPGHSEDPAPEAVKPPPTAQEPSNPAYDKSKARFYGLTPPQSAPAPEVKKEPTPNLHAELSQARFYAHEAKLNSPSMKEDQFKRDAAQFYSNTPPVGQSRTFEETLKTGTIHRKKPEGVATAELVLGDGFSSAAVKFYGTGSSVAGSRRDSRLSAASETGPAKAADSGLPPKPPSADKSKAPDASKPAEVPESRARSASSSASQRPPSTGYKFTLARAELKPPSAAGSRSSLKSSGQQVINA